MKGPQKLLLTCLLWFPLIIQAQTSIRVQEAREDIDWLQKSLEYIHPRLYKYTEKEKLDSLFQAARTEIASSDKEILALDLLSIISKLNAEVNCGHLYTIPQYELKEEILQKKVMPLYLKVIGKNLYVLDDCSKSDENLSGAKILSINERKSSEILQLMKAGIATDGYIESRKNRLIERYMNHSFHGFDLYFHLQVDRTEEFRIQYQLPGEKEILRMDLQGIGMDERKQLLKELYGKDERAWQNTPSPTFELQKEEDYAILRLPRSFYNKDLDPDFDTFLKTAFQELKSKEIKHLILDLRNNEGGSEHHQMELMSYLYDKPFKLYQNIYLSHLDFRPLKEIIIERDPKDLLFNNDDQYMRKISSDLWINNYKYGRSLNLQPPKKNTFEGKLYVLINGITFSSAADLAADIRKTTEATFIGEESGGTFEGPTGGNTIVVQLPHSKIMIRISPNIHIGYLYRKHPIGRGVLPDHEVEYTIEDYLQGKDLELEKALELIRKE